MFSKIKFILLFMTIYSGQIYASFFAININDIVNQQNYKNNPNEGIIKVWNQNIYQRDTFHCNATNLNKRYIITYTDCIIDPLTKKPYNNIVYYPNGLNNHNHNGIIRRKFISINNFEEGISTKSFRRGMDDKLITNLRISEEIAILEIKNYFTHFGCYLKNNDIIDRKITITKENNRTTITTSRGSPNIYCNQKNNSQIKLNNYWFYNFNN